MTVSEDLDQVVTLAAEVAALRQRLAQLDAERVTVEGQIADCVNRIAVATGAVRTPPPAANPLNTDQWEDSMALSAAVLYVLRQTPEKVFTALEIADILKMTDFNSRGAIRTHLSRMAKDGRVARVRFGKYKAG
jgi:hypothetical protein